MGRYWYTVPCWFDQTALGPISQFTVAICACADKNYSDQDCEIAIDLEYWMRLCHVY